ncbi:hypothetical protein OG21DRAFT_1448700 [Imleria badia]|nr:hypothetical protein OG21DRAFT_1448700 [Imleria badia]
MYDKPTSRVPTTVDALDQFFPGRQISLKPLDDRPEVSFTICKLSTPVTQSIVLLAKPDEPDAGDPKQVVIKIFDPRFLHARIPKIPSHRAHPWNFANEQAAAMARPQNLDLSYKELDDMKYSDNPDDLSGEELATHCLLWEEHFYRLVMESYDSELAAYDRLKEFQGSVIPRFIMAGKFIPPDERAIQPPALVLEYVPSVNLRDVSFDAITPAICAQLLSAVESFPLHGVIHCDLTLNNIHLSPPEQPVRGVVFDFGFAMIRSEDDEEEEWMMLGNSDVEWVRMLLGKDLRRYRASERDGRISTFN